MERLNGLGLDELLRERVRAGTPVLGICLGMQLAFDSSTERGGAAGLGIVAGEVHALQAGALKLPHIGWNEVTFTKAGSPLLAELPRRCAFYHVHSFAPVPALEEDTLGIAEYGAPFVSAVQSGSFYGVAVSPREVLGGRPAPARELRAHLHRGRRPGRAVRLYPAIDILGGNAVRLVKGDFEAKKVYDEDPLSAARSCVDGGARFMHVVDLDGAKSGPPVNLDHLRGIASLGVPVQYGGGLRSLEALDRALEAGAERVILGTAAFTDPGLLERALEMHGAERVVVSVDVRAGEVSIEGWTKAAEVGVREVFAELIERGVAGARVHERRSRRDARGP